MIASLEPRDIASVPALRNAEVARRKATGGQLAAAADQFIVQRGERHSIIAGYPWFADWGRDTMISLPGLTLCTARSPIAREILEEFGAWISDGMLPNAFPDQGEQPAYNSVDSALWYFEAVRAYVELTSDYKWLSDRIYAGLEGIVNAYVRGTRFNVRLDTDGLLHAGESGIALTWMDARVNGVPVTPRIGKPVEIQALWYNALRIMETFSARQDNSRTGFYAALADSTRDTFQTKFWNGSQRCLFDVVDVDGGGNDASIRPNQILAISLPHKLLEPEAALQVLEVVERELLTPFGLRSLSPRDPQYRGKYEGDVPSRDSSYHQGTVWPWLMGHFVVAWFEAHGRDAAARQRCLQWLAALKEYPNSFEEDEPVAGSLRRRSSAPSRWLSGAGRWSLALIIQAFPDPVY